MPRRSTPRRRIPTHGNCSPRSRAAMPLARCSRAPSLALRGTERCELRRVAVLLFRIGARLARGGEMLARRADFAQAVVGHRQAEMRLVIVRVAPQLLLELISRLGEIAAREGSDAEIEEVKRRMRLNSPQTLGERYVLRLPARPLEQASQVRHRRHVLRLGREHMAKGALRFGEISMLRVENAQRVDSLEKSRI